ncbi:MAG: DUF4296 domain-containing protein [Crocinitomicaceae bacterium]|jgi:hypothetical protein
MKHFFVFLLLVLCACNEPSVKTPPGLIDREKMSLVMEDVLLLESHYQSKYGVPGLYKNALDKSLTAVFTKHHVTKRQFMESYSYYASLPETFKALNTEIMDRLSRQEP